MSAPLPLAVITINLPMGDPRTDRVVEFASQLFREPPAPVQDVTPSPAPSASAPEQPKKRVSRPVRIDPPSPAQLKAAGVTPIVEAAARRRLRRQGFT